MSTERRVAGAAGGSVLTASRAGGLGGGAFEPCDGEGGVARAAVRDVLGGRMEADLDGSRVCVPRRGGEALVSLPRTSPPEAHGREMGALSAPMSPVIGAGGPRATAPQAIEELAGRCADLLEGRLDDPVGDEGTQPLGQAVLRCPARAAACSEEGSLWC